MTPLAKLDVEAISLAGWVWNDAKQAWDGPHGAPKGKKGLPVVGAFAYWEHPSAAVLCLSYKLPGDNHVSRWRPGDPPPLRLFAYLAAGGHIEFHNAMFEKLGWFHVLQKRFGWPPLDPAQVHCSMATAHVNGYPGGLENLGPALGTDVRKDPLGKALMDVFSKPRKPTKADGRLFIRPDDPEPFKFQGVMRDPRELFELYHGYCDTDVLTEEDAGARMEPMTPAEREAWLLDQEMNWRGIAIDRAGVRDCIAVLGQLIALYGRECEEITGGLSPSQNQALIGWIHGRGVHGIDSFDQKKSPIDEHLKRTDLPPDVRRVLEIRALTGSAGVKKLYAMENRTSCDDRLRGLFVHHGTRTGRPTGEGVQSTNLVKIGPKLAWAACCNRPVQPNAPACPWCGQPSPAPGVKGRWAIEMVDHVLEIMACRSLEMVQQFFGDAQLAIQGCIRGLLTSAPGNELIASDYSAIEAVVAACITGEQWRIDTFKRREDIYLQSAAAITGKTYEFYIAYFEEHGEHHPDRQNVGKIAELACLAGETLVWARDMKAWKPRGRWKRLDEITTDWQVHDGIRFVSHDGLAMRGVKPVSRKYGVLATDDHEFRVGRKWVRFDTMTDADWVKAGDSIMSLFTMMPKLSDMRPDRPTLVYDLLNAGPRHRFLIASTAGPVLAHNCGFGGWVGSWRAFDPDADNKTDGEIIPIISTWHDASPNIVEMWGGQRRKVQGIWCDELYGIEGAFIRAVQNPGLSFAAGPLSFRMTAPFGKYDRVKLRLPSGRELTYHEPILSPSQRRPGTLSISYMTDNSNPKYGALGWVRMETWGSRIFENAVQAIAHCVMRWARKHLMAAGYAIVQEVYDEAVAEVPIGWGSIEEFERIMGTLPRWAALANGEPWPVRAAGGWRGKRYRKA